MSLRWAVIENGRTELRGNVATGFLNALHGCRFNPVVSCEKTRSDEVALLDMVVDRRLNQTRE